MSNEEPITLKGLPASPGLARGPAVVVQSWEEIDKVSDGAVLVAKTTEPDMFLVFFRVCGVVTDFGGVTSHAAINALTLGIPCVVGTGNATSLIQDGDVIVVNGTNGDVTVERQKGK